MLRSVFLVLFLHASCLSAAPALRVSVFEVDATPPLGSPLCNGGRMPAVKIESPLLAKGVVLQGPGDPVVLCALDWVAVANETWDEMRTAIATATGTRPDRVAVQTLHQHDAPGSDFATEQLLAEYDLARQYSDPDFNLDVIRRMAEAAAGSMSAARPVSHVGLGSGTVEKVASNRRILGADGRVAIVRYSSSRNPRAIEAPEGLIDPELKQIALYDQEEPLVVLTYYATHPQSYYGKGGVNWEFVGMARQQRQKSLNGVPHIHFDGAGGNIAAGKYNDGSPELRPLLAERMAAGMRHAWESQQKFSVAADEFHWSVQHVHLPARSTMREQALQDVLADPQAKPRLRIRAARDLTWLRRTQAGHRIPLQCLHLGPAKILHMPSELFVEYQLAAQQMAPNAFVAMAAYGDSGPGYIGTAIAYEQGGYETSVVSRVGPEVEPILMRAMQQLLEAVD